MFVRLEIHAVLLCIFLSIFAGATAEGTSEGNMDNVDLWKLANEKKDVLRFSTLFTAQDVRDFSDPADLENVIEWCKQTAVTHIYVESFRHKYTARREDLERAKKAFLDAGLDVSGCVTPTQVGKPGNGWTLIDCYTDIPTQEHLQEIFEYTASMFDEIMIDDFLFIDCTCDECQAARGDKSWIEYRRDLMLQVSRERVVEPAKAKNPNVKIIIKYPQWYEEFHLRGYEVVKETQEYDGIWIGTETRDPDNQRWGREAQYKAYFIMRWLGGIGGEKSGGGWFDPYGTSPPTYVEQARQTILGDAKEALLFCYGTLLEDRGPANVKKLRTEIPALFELAELVRGKPIKGILAPKPPSSEPHSDRYIFDFLGMLGLPLVPSDEITDAEAFFLSTHALKDQELMPKLKRMIDSGKPLLITDGLRDRSKDQIDLEADNIQILETGDEPRSIMNMDRASLLNLREKMLKPFGINFDAPSKVSLYLIGDDLVVIENFNDEVVDVQLRMSGLTNAEELITLPVEQCVKMQLDDNDVSMSISPRSMVAMRIHK